MTAWFPVTASLLAVTGISSFWAFGGADCSMCSAPASTPAAITTTVDIEEAVADAALEETDVYVLKFHADWCGRCKAMNPVYDSLVEGFDDEPVGFVKVDVTNKTKAKASEKMLKELGLDKIWADNKGRNGFILLVDAETKKSGKVLKPGTSKEDAAKALNDALKS
ncbi:MAG: thioredoxin domain-containing protein [Planctomycetota bacterium]